MLLKLSVQTVVCLLSITIVLSTHADTLKSNTFAYIGQPSSTQGQLLNLGGYRHYNPATRSFLKQDGYTPFQGRSVLNGYQYGTGNPVLLTDQTGHDAINPNTWVIAGSILGGSLIISGGVGGAIVYHARTTRNQPVPSNPPQPTARGETMQPTPSLTESEINRLAQNAARMFDAARLDRGGLGFFRVRNSFGDSGRMPTSLGSSITGSTRYTSSLRDSQGALPINILTQESFEPGEFILTHHNGNIMHQFPDTPEMRAHIANHGCPTCRQAQGIGNWTRSRIESRPNLEPREAPSSVSDVTILPD